MCLIGYGRCFHMLTLSWTRVTEKQGTRVKNEVHSGYVLLHSVEDAWGESISPTADFPVIYNAI